MRDHHDCHPSVKYPEFLVKIILKVGINKITGFIQKQEPGISDYGPAEKYPLKLAAGKFAQ